MPQGGDFHQQQRNSAPWRYFQQKPFVRADRERTTILFGGLTWKHERLLRGVFKAFGYHAEIIPTPTVEDFQAGKEYGNYGQCSPVYFTAGSLVNYLKRLERDGLSRQEIVERYVYITPESPCGPCRLGMYQSEYRLVAENAGFHGFRVIPVSQHPKLSDDAGAGLEINTDLSLAIILAVLMGDVINDPVYSIRPFEVKGGETERVAEAGVAYLEDVISRMNITGLEPTGGAAAFQQRHPSLKVILKLQRWLCGTHFQTLLDALRRVGQDFDSIDIDRTRTKPVVKVIGEFWDQMTEGDGNFQILRFLETEGAQILIEPVASWFQLTIHWARQHNQDSSTLIPKDEANIKLGDRTRARVRKEANAAIIELIDKTFIWVYQRMRNALRGIPHALVSQPLLETLADPFYHSRLDAGEAHTEVGKNIYYSGNRLVHMVLSLKPFGCLPSTQSDAVQAAVQGAYGDMIFLPIETSGEGRINAVSRVQMALGEAKQKARGEVEKALLECGLTLDKVKRAVELRPELKRPSTTIPRHRGTVGTAANLVWYVRDLLRKGLVLEAQLTPGR